jgi:hypothetical protein
MVYPPPKENKNWVYWVSRMSIPNSVHHPYFFWITPPDMTCQAIGMPKSSSLGERASINFNLHRSGLRLKPEPFCCPRVLDRDYTTKPSPLDPGFLFPILWCSQGGCHLESDLAKFGHTNMERGKNQNLSIFWPPTGTNNKNLAIDRIFSKSGEFGPFFHEIPSHTSKSSRDLAKIRQQKKRCRLGLSETSRVAVHWQKNVLYKWSIRNQQSVESVCRVITMSLCEINFLEHML